MFDMQHEYEKSERVAQEIVKLLQGFSYEESCVILSAVKNLLTDARAQDYLDEKARQEGDGEKEGRK